MLAGRLSLRRMVEAGRDPIEEAAAEARRMTVVQLVDRYLSRSRRPTAIIARSAAQWSVMYFRLLERGRRKMSDVATLSLSLIRLPNVGRLFRLTGSEI